MIKILLTSGHNPFSAIIRRLTKEDASHIAIEWNGWVLHSNLNGVQWQSSESFRSKAVVINEKPIDSSTEKLLEFSARYVEHGMYDVGALFYIGVKLALGRVGVKIPKKNLWRCTGMFMCTELVSAYTFGIEDAMITPQKLFDKIPLRNDQ